MRPARRPGRLLRCVAGVMALGARASYVAGGAARAQQGPPTASEDKAKKPEEDKAKKPEGEKGKRATLTVHVLLADAGRTPKNAENATVKIKGEGDWRSTANDGTRPAETTAPGVKTLIIRVS